MWSYQPNVLSPVAHKYILHIKVLSRGNKELACKILYKLAQKCWEATESRTWWFQGQILGLQQSRWTPNLTQATFKVLRAFMILLWLVKYNRGEMLSQCERMHHLYVANFRLPATDTAGTLIIYLGSWNSSVVFLQKFLRKNFPLTPNFPRKKYLEGGGTFKIPWNSSGVEPCCSTMIFNPG